MAERIATGYRPRPLQAGIHRRLRRFSVLVCHRRFGKTVLCVNELIDHAVRSARQRPRYAYIAPLYRQAKQVAWDYLKHYTAPIPGREVNETELRVDLPNGARIQLYGADNPDSLRGIYLDGAVLDEYAQMSPHLWGEVIRPALADREGWAIFIGTPKGHNAFWRKYRVRRRWLDEDPAGREAASVLERALSFLVDDGGFDAAMEAVRDDMLLPGRGVARIVYEPTIARRELERADGEDGEISLLDGRPVEPDGFDGGTPYAEEIVDERVHCRHVFWKDYREQPARCWDEVRWIAFRHALARGELVERFGAAGREIPLEGAVDAHDGRDRAETAPEAAKRAVLWEIWDKSTRRRIVIADGFDRVVEEADDPLGLAGFFPVPEPLYAVKTSDSRVPIPEFTLYQDQALELDELTTRKRHLIAALRARGVYAGVLGEIERLLTEGGENEMIPVKDWDRFRDKGGLAAAIEWLPIERIAQVIVSLNAHIAQLKAEIFEITGLSDIVRGSTHASETATAQRLKGSFGTMRMQPRQRPMERFVRDVLRLKAEAIAEHFRSETLARMTGKPVPPAVLRLLRDERLRGFRIDIETESTVQPDAEAERRNAVEFLSASTQFFTGIAPLIAAAPQSAPMFLEMFRMAARTFKPGRRLEEVIARTGEALIERANAGDGRMP